MNITRVSDVSGIGFFYCRAYAFGISASTLFGTQTQYIILLPLFLVFSLNCTQTRKSHISYPFLRFSIGFVWSEAFCSVLPIEVMREMAFDLGVRLKKRPFFERNFFFSCLTLRTSARNACFAYKCGRESRKKNFFRKSGYIVHFCRVFRHPLG